jgi:hypothetical protein
MVCRCRSGECDPECDGPKLRAEIAWLQAEVERLRAASSYVRQRLARAGEILNEFDNTHPRDLVRPL